MRCYGCWKQIILDQGGGGGLCEVLAMGVVDQRQGLGLVVLCTPLEHGFPSDVKKRFKE